MHDPTDAFDRTDADDQFDADRPVAAREDGRVIVARIDRDDCWLSSDQAVAVTEVR